MKSKINKTFFVTNCDILIDADYEILLIIIRKVKIVTPLLHHLEIMKFY